MVLIAPLLLLFTMCVHIDDVCFYLALAVLTLHLKHAKRRRNPEQDTGTERTEALMILDAWTNILSIAFLVAFDSRPFFRFSFFFVCLLSFCLFRLYKNLLPPLGRKCEPIRSISKPKSKEGRSTKRAKRSKRKKSRKEVRSSTLAPFCFFYFLLPPEHATQSILISKRKQKSKVIVVIIWRRKCFRRKEEKKKKRTSAISLSLLFSFHLPLFSVCLSVLVFAMCFPWFIFPSSSSSTPMLHPICKGSNILALLLASLCQYKREETKGGNEEWRSYLSRLFLFLQLTNAASYLHRIDILELLLGCIMPVSSQQVNQKVEFDGRKDGKGAQDAPPKYCVARESVETTRAEKKGGI